ALWEERAPAVFGFGAATRDYVHVDDLVEVVRAASGVAGVFNVATGVETSVRDVYDAVQRELGTTIDPRLEPLREGGLERSCMDPSNAQRVLGWQPRIVFGDGVRSTVRALVEEFEAAA